MGKPAAYLFAVLVGAIVWFFFQHFKVEGTRIVPKTEQELNQMADSDSSSSEKPSFGLPGFLPRFDGFGTSTPADDVAGNDATSAGALENDTIANPLDQPVAVKPAKLQVAPKRSGDTIRIASFHLLYFGSSVADPTTVDTVAQVVRYFDIVALQGIHPNGASAVVEMAQRAGSEYEAIMGRPATIQQQDEQFAYIINRNTIIADRGDGLYSLGEPDNLLRREPLIGWFRAKAASADHAFTFSLMNVNIERLRAKQELNVLDNAMFEVRNDGRQEDDVIILGSFQAAETDLGDLGRIAGLVATIRGVPTNLNGTEQTENILFQTPATDEFTGRTGVFNFLRAFNMNSEQASQVSDYLPVWAEFSIYEGGQKGRVARAAFQ